MGPDTVIRAAGGIALVPLTVYAAVREVPRLTAALAELAADDGPIGRAAELKLTVDGLVAPGGQLEDLSGVGPSLERLVGLADTLDRLAAPGGALDRSPEANRRMVALINALRDAGEPLDGLQIWQLDSEDYGQDGFGNVDPGELR